MVLIFHGRQSADHSSKESCYPWEPLAEALTDMVSKGLVEEEKLDSFNVPYYMPSLDEVQGVVGEEGSFETERLLTFALEYGDEEEEDMWAKGAKIAKNIRSFTEPLISHHFGEEIIEQLFEKFTRAEVEDLAKEPVKVTSIVIQLKRGDESPA